MTHQNCFFKPGAILLCLLALAFSSSRVVYGQNGQQPEKPKGDTPDYIIIDGDIQVSPEFFQKLVEQGKLVKPGRQLRAGAVNDNENQLWPGGVVPFEFDSNVTADNRTRMIEAMAELEGIANVDFRHCGNDDCSGNYVHIQNSSGNNSRVGMKCGGSPRCDGKQDINIFNWNIRFVMVHELMHCLGLWHEQNRSNRDNYIRINCDNVEDGCGLFSSHRLDFNINSDTFGFGSYDFDSVMQYPQCGFSKNDICPTPTPDFPDGGVTITVLPPNDTFWQSRIGQRDHFSELDRTVVSFLYPPSDWRFFDILYNGDRGSSNGTFHRPYTNFAEAVAKTPEGGTLWILKSQTIPAVGTYGKQITVKTAPGVVATLGS